MSHKGSEVAASGKAEKFLKPTFSEENLASLSKAFALSDICTGRSGKVPATEVANTMRMLGQCPNQLEAQQVVIDVELLRRKKLAARKAALEKQKAEESKKKKGKGKKQKLKAKGIWSTLNIFSVHT